MNVQELVPKRQDTRDVITHLRAENGTLNWLRLTNSDLKAWLVLKREQVFHLSPRRAEKCVTY